MSGTNLTPFGFDSAPPDTDRYAADALSRAGLKLQALRSHSTNERPVGTMASLTVGPIALCALASLLPLLIGVVALSDSTGKGVKAGAVFLMISAALIGLAVLLFVLAKANKPAKALKYFFKSVARGNAAKAASLVVSNDLDDFPRYPPVLSGFGPAAVRPFYSSAELGGYWSELVRYHSAPYCIVSLHRVRETQLAPDLVAVDCEVRFIMNTQLWLLLVLVALIIALIVDLATRKTVKIQVRKLLYKVGDEWKLFNGELQGAEELDLRWLPEGGALPDQ